MEHVQYRRYPRIYKKKAEAKKDKELILSTAAAAGILALAFFKGMFWGYLIKRKMG